MPSTGSHFSKRGPRGGRRYLIHSDQFVTCMLVYSADGTWHVEKSGADGERVRLTFQEFEKGETGARLAPQLAAAIAQAQNDL
jgi:hypothetical protein